MESRVLEDLKLSRASIQYDAHAINALSNKIVLAHILIHVIDEFKGRKPEQVAALIEGEPLIRQVPVNRGETNRELPVHADEPIQEWSVHADEPNQKWLESPEEANQESQKPAGSGGVKIHGLNTVDKELYEGTVLFDILFYVRMEDGLTKIIINVEAQKSAPKKYALPDRGIYYASRLISSQKGRDFSDTNYSDLLPVYSIWIVMNMDECTLHRWHIQEDELLGSYAWNCKRDLLNVVVIGLPKTIPEKNEEFELHRMLAAMFTSAVSLDERIEILKEEYDIQEDANFRKEMKTMCNLGLGIWEQGIEQGIERGEKIGMERGSATRAQRTAKRLFDRGDDIEGIADILETDVAQVASWLGIALV